MEVIMGVLIAIFLVILFQIYRMYTSCKVPPPRKNKKEVVHNDSDDEPVVEIVS